MLEPKVAVPGPVKVHSPKPTLAVAASVKSKSHSSPPKPALATGCSKKLTVIDLKSIHVPFVSVQVNSYVPYVSTVIVFIAEEALLNVAVPVPLVCDQSPVPTLGTALVRKFKSHSSPPKPATAAGCS